MKIPFLPKIRSSGGSPSPAKVKKQKQKALNSLERSKQRQDAYRKRLRERV